MKERDNADQLTKKRKLDEAEKLAVYDNGTPTLEAFIEKKKKYQPDNATHKFLSAPMGSIASEREFKIAKRVTQGRYNLKPENVQKLLFLKYNLILRMLNYNLDL